MNRFLPLVIFVAVLAIGLAMTFFVYRAEEAVIESRFGVYADDSADRVRERVEQHIAFLQAAHSFFSALKGEVTHDGFATFVDGLDLDNKLAGIQGIGYARLIPVGDEQVVDQLLTRNYGAGHTVWPEQTDQDRRASIVLLEPDNERNDVALGYDMFSEPTRRAAMIGAIGIDGPYASAPVELVQEITSDKQSGFLVYVPLRSADTSRVGGEVLGFVYAPFRAGDLHEAALRRSLSLPVVIETTDVTLGSASPLYRSPDFDNIAKNSAFEVTRNFNVAGRNWQMRVVSTPAFGTRTPSPGVFALGSISLLLAVALALSTQAQIRALDTARELHSTAEKNLQDKEMMLQEMKHRIKNSIARVLAIARQTAAHSETLEGFTESYVSRLQAMANAQDMLTRSHWQRADLQNLLSTELEQVFGDDPSGFDLAGRPVDLSERATQALGLVFHELATNALKYGNVTETGGALSVRWSLVPATKPTTLEIVWSEQTAAPQQEPGGSGFGTRLIDMNIRAELDGTIERSFTPEGLIVRLLIPIKSYS